MPLKSNILQLLGDEPVIQAVEGPPIHEAIVHRWTNILKKWVKGGNQARIIARTFSTREFKKPCGARIKS